ncbi:hypothetical protein QAD02_008186 [Eretmocerus hayati]|uniref:Uncharacterized protein n=1 Tax=Eretmocerus hayati TaxID=131215 RepID=A0ACC2N653_9HYME|nr:hypothetical protein QAD02_008186 [Eretmocerus hayati]
MIGGLSGSLCGKFYMRIRFARVYRTGDYARLKNQQLFYEGRRDNQIKVRGHRIDLSEIERVVLNMVVVDDVAVLPKKDENSGEVSGLMFMMNEFLKNKKSYLKSNPSNLAGNCYEIFSSQKRSSLIIFGSAKYLVGALELLS